MTIRSRATREVVRSNSQYTFLQWKCQAELTLGGRCAHIAAYKVDGDGGDAMLCTRHYALFCKHGKIIVYG